MKQGLLNLANQVVESRTFDYEGNPVTFGKGDNVMVNATQMAKPFGKSAKDWLKTKSTNDFINTLAEVKKIHSLDLVQVTYGDNGGTWMHEDVAMEFARWLSPKFAIWCNDRIKELMSVGMTATPMALEAMLSNPDLVIGMATQLKAYRAEIAEQQRKIAEDAPKVLFADAVVGSTSTCLIGELAKILTQNGYPIGQNRLFAWLREHGYLGKHGERKNIPNQQYVEMGLFDLKKNIHSENGVMKTTITPKVTGKGQQYFINKFLAR